jgi:hypothetical protein
MLWSGGVGRDEGQVDGGLKLGAQFALCLLGGFFEPLMGHGILAQVDTFGFLEFIGEIVYQQCV